MTTELTRAPVVPSRRRLGMLGVVALVLIALVPLLPRPTSAGIGSLAAPSVGAALVYCAFMDRLMWPKRRSSAPFPARWTGMLVAATAFYALRVAAQADSTEFSFVLSRLLLLTIVVSCCLVFSQTTTELVFKWFAYGGMVLGVLVAYVGITGAVILEAPSPARTLGIELPVFKTAGVPRSYGEQGIILSLILAYLLGYWTRMGMVLKLGLLVTCGFVLVMGQSRNMLLASLVVVLTWFLVARRRRWRQLRLVLILCAVATFLVEQLLPLMTSTGLGRALVGQGIFEVNVTTRFEVSEGAVNLISSSPFAAVIGFDHADWSVGVPDYEGVGVHNHFLATLLFVGLIAGVVTLWALFIGPAAAVLRSLEQNHLTEPQVLRRQVLMTAMAGVLVSLNFYEGFFSFALAIFVGLLWLLGVNYDADIKRKGLDQLPSLG